MHLSNANLFLVGLTFVGLREIPLDQSPILFLGVGVKFVSNDVFLWSVSNSLQHRFPGVVC
ncbi:hypothetical protein, partial [uncultured Microbacterium sp.]|uniref:hypothetical protein n=1 Tax=uncultured Microbacterium sp. TaxID=191216 RepID=UPI0025E0CD88